MPYEPRKDRWHVSRVLTGCSALNFLQIRSATDWPSAERTHLCRFLAFAPPPYCFEIRLRQAYGVNARRDLISSIAWSFIMAGVHFGSHTSRTSTSFTPGISAVAVLT